MEEVEIRIPQSLYEELIHKAEEYDKIMAKRNDAAKRSNSNRDPEVRKATAKKAVEARWAKYRAEKGAQ